MTLTPSKMADQQIRQLRTSGEQCSETIMMHMGFGVHQNCRGQVVHMSFCLMHPSVALDLLVYGHGAPADLVMHQGSAHQIC